MYAYTMEHICSYGVTLHSPFEVIGETPLGLRVNAYVSGGTVEGPRIRGEFLPVGGDWLTVRSDGVGVLDVRATIRTHDEALIYVQYQGVLELGDDGYAGRQSAAARADPLGAAVPQRAPGVPLGEPAAVRQYRRGRFCLGQRELRRLRPGLKQGPRAWRDMPSPATSFDQIKRRGGGVRQNPSRRANDPRSIRMAHPLAGHPAPKEYLTDIPALLAAYTGRQPDADDPAQRVAFGTSGHRGSALAGSFNEAHVLAIAQAVCDYRAQAGISGPLYLGKDTHALSAPAERSALEVLAANGIDTRMQAGEGFTPTPVISRAILAWNRAAGAPRADGIVITPSHNPPPDGGIKYNPPHGGPADTDITGWIEARANALMAAGNRDVKRVPCAQALAAAGE